LEGFFLNTLYRLDQN